MVNGLELLGYTSFYCVYGWLLRTGLARDFDPDRAAGIGTTVVDTASGSSIYYYDGSSAKTIGGSAGAHVEEDEWGEFGDDAGETDFAASPQQSAILTNRHSGASTNIKDSVTAAIGGVDAEDDVWGEFHDTPAAVPGPVASGNDGTPDLTASGGTNMPADNRGDEWDEFGVAGDVGVAGDEHEPQEDMRRCAAEQHVEVEADTDNVFADNGDDEWSGFGANPNNNNEIEAMADSVGVPNTKNVPEDQTDQHEKNTVFADRGGDDWGDFGDEPSNELAGVDIDDTDAAALEEPTEEVEELKTTAFDDDDGDEWGGFGAAAKDNGVLVTRAAAPEADASDDDDANDWGDFAGAQDGTRECVADPLKATTVDMGFGTAESTPEDTRSVAANVDPLTAAGLALGGEKRVIPRAVDDPFSGLGGTPPVSPKRVAGTSSRDGPSAEPVADSFSGNLNHSGLEGEAATLSTASVAVTSDDTAATNDHDEWGNFAKAPSVKPVLGEAGAATFARDTNSSPSNTTTLRNDEDDFADFDDGSQPARSDHSGTLVTSDHGLSADGNGGGGKNGTDSGGGDDDEWGDWGS